MTDERLPTEDDDVAPESYADLAALAKTLTDDDSRYEEPPADLWSRIEAQVLVREQTTGEHEAVRARTRGEPEPAPPPVARLDEARARRNRLPLTFLGVAAALIVVAIIGAVVIATGGDDVTTVGDVALVNTNLDPRGSGSHGEAALVQLDDGSYALDIDVEGLPTESGDFYELWIIDTNVEGMVSLGPLHGNGRYTLPASVDPRAFPVVDISIEPTDGVPTHSGDSVLRGILDT